MKTIHYIGLNDHLTNQDENLLLKIAQSSKTISDFIFDAMLYYGKFKTDKITRIIMPCANGDSQLNIKNLNFNEKDAWLIISNGRYVTKFNQELIKKLTAKNETDLILLNIDSSLQSYRENTILKSDNEVAGYRRFFSDSVMPDGFPDKWPNHTLIKLSALKAITNDETIPLRFCIFLKRSILNHLKIQTFKIGGQNLDLQTKAGILRLMNEYLTSNQSLRHKNTASISPTVRLYGNVLIGENVKIEDKAIIIGPAIIGDNVTIPNSSTINRSIICLSLPLEENSFIRRQIIGLPEPYVEEPDTNTSYVTSEQHFNNFRTWPLFSYTRLGKRLCDLFFSVMVLPIFSIIAVFVAIAIKLTSQGPIFFKHKRQGLGGKAFSCLKFRTMITDADAIQEKLGFKNQVDGPQFKIDDDPRITTIGAFLRETHIDEIPQFINVVLGQMSLIGPRPSPAKENSFCSYWRDARLSVRPGITGSWQIYRTRQQGQDFQEWIYYDTRYVKNLSFRQDIIIFFDTAIKLILNFLKHL